MHVDRNTCAFPSHVIVPKGAVLSNGATLETDKMFINDGMMLRDYFAAHILAGVGTWMPAGFGDLTSDAALVSRAEWAYRQADALMAARDK